MSQFPFMDEPSDDESSNNFVTVAQIGEVPEGEGRTVHLDKRPIALFLHKGKYMAIDDLCPHQGASLSAGAIVCDDTDCDESNEGPTVSCPWHAWRFRLSDGKWADNPRLGVDTFETRVSGKDIQIRPITAE